MPTSLRSRGLRVPRDNSGFSFWVYRLLTAKSRRLRLAQWRWFSYNLNVCGEEIPGDACVHIDTTLCPYDFFG